MEGPDAMMRVTIAKTTSVIFASPVIFMVVPLTIDEALDNGVLAEFEPLDLISPNRAGKLE